MLVFSEDLKFENRREYMDWKKNQRTDKELQRAARKNTLEVDMNDVKKEHEASGALFQEIQNAAGCDNTDCGVSISEIEKIWMGCSIDLS